MQSPTTYLQIEEKTKEGAFWTTSGAFLREAILFAFGVVVARLLLPEVFGLYGIANLFTNIGSIIFGLGLSATIIQRKDLKPEHLSTAYSMNIAFALLLMAILIGLSPLIARFYNNPLLIYVLPVVSLGFLFNSSCSIHQGLLIKSFQFKKIALISLASILASGVLAVILALKGFGVWSLVISGLALQAVTCFPTILVSGWKPRLGFNIEVFKELGAFGSMIMIGNLIGFLSLNVDHFIIGKFLGFASLGYYTRASGLVILPLQKISTIVDYVAFPTYAHIQDEKELLQVAYLKASAALAFLAFPLICGLGILAPEFVAIMYGPTWSATTTPLRILSLATILMVVHSMAGSIFIALGKAKIFFNCQVIRLFLTAGAALTGSYWGLIGACWAVFAANLIYLVIVQAFISRYVGVGAKRVFHNLLPFFTLILVMMLVTTGYRFVIGKLFPQVNALVSLLMSVMVGAAAYFLSIKTLHFKEVDSIYGEIINKLKEKFLYSLKITKVET